MPPEPLDPKVAQAISPVAPDKERPPAEKGLAEGRALCLSGGGYRAMVFHAGVLWRFNEAGYLKTLDRVSCVSGGAITGAVLGLKWSRLDFDGNGVGRRFVEEFVAPIRQMAGRTIDDVSVISGALLPGVSIADRIIAAYRRHLFGKATLQDLPPDPPRIVLNATNVQTGSLWRFMRPYMRDYRVGEVKDPKLELAVAVAASSAFPPILSPVRLDLDPADFTPGNEPLHKQPYTSDVVLTDGGVYDNLGLETAWKRYKTIFVSDGGGQMQPEPEPKGDFARHSLRINSLTDNQVRSLRKRQVVGSFILGLRNGAYWNIRTDLTKKYPQGARLSCPFNRTQELAATPTRLRRLDDSVQERLINWGYALTDAALRQHFDPNLPNPKGFPYPVGV
jgi:NTE family protein